ncbi:MAG TPA: c-type cytochrome [Solirubrobacteraceae bacterium]|nr:c-type cytochrome [Solirubrobacteraceae bacterium]
MNQRQKEEYLREYSILKSEGKPFFPYAVAKDAAMACIVMAIIITLSILFGAELGPKVNPTSTTYVPRPDWYFFFLFELLRITKPPSLTGLATVGIPTLGMILLFLLPFFDRSPERRPERRPVAMFTLVFVVGAMAFLTYDGATIGTPTALEIKTPKAVIAQGAAAVAKFEAGRLGVAQSGCEACHDIAGNGNPGPGPELTHIGARVPEEAIARTLDNPIAPMPSFRHLPNAKFEAIIYFLSQLK